MRWSRVPLKVAVLLLVALPAAQPVSAQSFLERLFGWGSARAPEPRTEPYDRLGAPDFYSPPDNGGWEEDTATYRTLCVRTCDGFYFPIGDNVRRARLYSDSRQCAQRCDGEARLFYYPTHGGSPETMVDLSGRSYASLPNAFRYRKALVEGCTCKPAPWSPEEAARHQGYAAQQSVRAASTPEDVGEPRERARTAASGIYTDEGENAEEPPEYESRREILPWRTRYGWRD